MSEIAVIELQADSDGVGLRNIAANLGAELVEHPDLDRRHVAVRAPQGTLEALAQLDEVNYVFPASNELATGAPTIPCRSGLGNLAGDGIVSSNLTATFGDGWDGPGLGVASLSYWFGTLTPSLPSDSIRVRFSGRWLRGRRS